MRWCALTLCLVLIQGTAASVAAADPQLIVTGPQDGQDLAGPVVQVTFQVSGLRMVPSSVPLTEAGQHPEVNRPGEGHLHFMLDLEPVVVWYSTDPYTLANLPPGRHHLMVELVNNDHSSLSPPVVREVQFQRTAGTLPNTGDGPPPEVPQVLAVLGGALLVTAGALVARAACRPGEGRRR